jgi:uncharacterized protein YbaR (Trm112 family)
LTLPRTKQDNDAMSDSANTPDHDSTGTAGIDPRLLEILVCPLTKGPLRFDREKMELISDRAGLAYPIRDGIPIMLPDEARRLDNTR